MDDIYTILFFIVLSFFLGALFQYKPDEQIIKHFKNPTCIEKEIGKETIKACYKIVKIKEKK